MNPSAPRLVVVPSIGQIRADHLNRYASLYEHGFARLLREGVHFRTADLNYARSSTGPGHATLGTGTYPWKTELLPTTTVNVQLEGGSTALTIAWRSQLMGMAGGRFRKTYFAKRNNLDVIIISNDSLPIFVEKEELPTNYSNNHFFVYEMKVFDEAKLLNFATHFDSASLMS